MATAQELLQQRNDLQSQLNASMAPVASGDYSRYLTEKVGGFQPLIEERRALEAQANTALPSMIQQYTQQRQANPMGSASPLTALNNIFQSQAQTRGTANVLGDLLGTYQGRLSNLSQDAMSMVGQRQKQLGNQFDVLNQDYLRQLQIEEADKARRAIAAQQAAMFGAYGQNAGGGYASGDMGGSLTIDNQPSTLDRIGAITGLNNPANRVKQIVNTGNNIFNKIDPNAQVRSTVSNIFKPSNDFLNNLTGGNLYKGLGKLGIM